jgi:hypothetical protein
MQNVRPAVEKRAEPAICTSPSPSRRASSARGERGLCSVPGGIVFSGSTAICSVLTGLERVTGIEPAFSAWEADVLPLNYTRVDDGDRREAVPG